MPFSAIYITTSGQDEANRIARHLLDKKMVACANIFPIASAYWWRGNLEQNAEFVCLVKTVDELWERVKAEVEAIHSYETPCVMRIGVEANRRYEDWIKSEVEL